MKNDPPIRERDVCPRCEGTIFHRHGKRAQTSCRTCGLVLKDPYNYVKGIQLEQIQNYDYYQWDLEDQFDYWFRDPLTPIDENDFLFDDNKEPSYDELSHFGKKIKRINKDPRNAVNCAEKVYLLKLHKQTPYVKDNGEIAWRGNPKEWRLYQAFYKVDNIASHYKMSEYQSNWVKTLIEAQGTKIFHRKATNEQIILGLCFYIMRKEGRGKQLYFTKGLSIKFGLNKDIYKVISRNVTSLLKSSEFESSTYIVRGEI